MVDAVLHRSLRPAQQHTHTTRPTVGQTHWANEWGSGNLPKLTAIKHLLDVLGRNVNDSCDVPNSNDQIHGLNP